MFIPLIAVYIPTVKTSFGLKSEYKSNRLINFGDLEFAEKKLKDLDYRQGTEIRSEKVLLRRAEPWQRVI